MRVKSIRTRLTLWNICVLTLILVVLSLAVKYTVESYLLREADRELERRALRTADFFAHHDDRFSDDARRPERPRVEGREGSPRREPTRLVRVFDRSGKMLASFGSDVRPSEPPWDGSLFRRSLDGRSGYSTIVVDKEQLRVYSHPIVRDGKNDGAVQVAYRLTELNRFLQTLTLILFALFPFALLAAGFGGMFITTRWLRPVREITSAAEDMSASDLSRRLPTAGDDEFSRLASTFNSMLGRLETAFRELENSVEQQRRFTADASHELRTPLTTIKANTSLALRQARTAEEYREALSAADSAADMMDNLIRDLLLLASSDDGQMPVGADRVNLADVCREAIALARARDGGADVRLDVPDEALATIGSPHHLSRLVVNLVDNALRHTPANGVVTVTAVSEAANIILTIADNGEGIAPEHIPHLCERFYRVDKARTRSHGGTGLGLAICRSIVEAHNGTLLIESAPGKGTTVTVTLPNADAPWPSAG